MRRKPLEHGDKVLIPRRVVVVREEEVEATIVKFLYRRCYCRTEQRVKLERTHALLQIGNDQVKVPYRKVKRKAVQI